MTKVIAHCNSEHFKTKVGKICVVLREFFDNGESWYELKDVNTGEVFESPSIFWEEQDFLKHCYEGLSNLQNITINKKIERLKDLASKGLITKKEQEYLFLTFLQGLDFLSGSKVFEVYTNTDF